MQRKENLIFKKIYEGDRIRQTRLKKGLKKTLRGERENEVRKYNNRWLEYFRELLTEARPYYMEIQEE